MIYWNPLLCKFAGNGLDLFNQSLIATILALPVWSGSNLLFQEILSHHHAQYLWSGYCSSFTSIDYHKFFHIVFGFVKVKLSLSLQNEMMMMTVCFFILDWDFWCLKCSSKSNLIMNIDVYFLGSKNLGFKVSLSFLWQ